ncbi:hypothetical protein [Geminocystis sp. GBBB08]|uniref:hypothetical protein n=1 Tax=Geminocystis sp. GBBB08 TaxID=2604140 RepID=UPI0027E2BECD|nr:hypothetical protein [Geminocystis sp. GBBB08]MBL1208265.1 hypothetical protein [Geminocystis sp. GBBB08]
MTIPQELMLQEIHACLGAGEFAYDNDKPYYMHMARKLDKIAKALGVAFNPDGSIMSVRKRVNIPYDDKGKATIPDGWTRGQFADNKGGSTTGQTGGLSTEERLGIAYQNRCNRYENFDDNDPENNIMRKGDIVLCENWMQYQESYIDDLDKGLNWQEIGAGMLPSADGSKITSYEGLGTLLAEVAYMLSSLSSNIYQTHVLGLKTTNNTLEILKALGLPIDYSQMKIDIGESDPVSGDNIQGYIEMPKVNPGAVSIHKRLMDVITNIAIINGAILSSPPPVSPTP